MMMHRSRKQVKNFKEKPPTPLWMYFAFLLIYFGSIVLVSLFSELVIK